jgi:hypothetical protein
MVWPCTFWLQSVTIGSHGDITDYSHSSTGPSNIRPPYSGQGGQVYSNRGVVTLIRDPYNVFKRN